MKTGGRKPVTDVKRLRKRLAEAQKETSTWKKKFEAEECKTERLERARDTFVEHIAKRTETVYVVDTHPTKKPNS